MSETDHDLHLASEVGDRFAAWLRQHYTGPAAAKRIAKAHHCSEPTAKRWLSGSLPDTRTLLAMLAHWGAPFAAAVLAPTGPWVAAVRTAAELDALHTSLSRTADLIRATRGGPPPRSPAARRPEALVRGARS